MYKMVKTDDFLRVLSPWKMYWLSFFSRGCRGSRGGGGEGKWGYATAVLYLDVILLFNCIIIDFILLIILLKSDELSGMGEESQRKHMMEQYRAYLREFKTGQDAQ